MLNNPLLYVDPDGMDVHFANDKLREVTMKAAEGSPTMLGEIADAEADQAVDVEVVERGAHQNQEHSDADTKAVAEDENRQGS
jgi:type IV secretory pathway VirB6-like protein